MPEGKISGTADWITIDQSMIDIFADNTRDRQFIHIDPRRAAKETPFGGTIAHGFLVLSLISGQFMDDLMQARKTRSLLNYGMNKLRFIEPVVTGSKVRTVWKVAHIEEKKTGKLLSLDISMEIEGKEKPSFIAEMLVFEPS